MLLNYLRLSFRLLARNPFFTGINVIGLAVAFTAFYVLWQYSASELKSDRHHKDADRIGRIGLQWQWLEQRTNSWEHLIFAFSKTSLLQSVKDDFPEVESTLRILNQNAFNNELVNHGDRIAISVDQPTGTTKTFKEEKIAYADSNLFSFFSVPLKYGQPENVLNGANFAVLSHSTALKYFGNINPTGELLRLNDTSTLKVTGVYEDLPNYTHLNFDLVISNTGLLNKWDNDRGGWNGAICYVKLLNGQLEDFEIKLRQKADLYWSELRSRPNRKLDMFIQPLAEVPFNPFVGDFFAAKSKPFLIMLEFIAFSILAMAWVNYVNLAIARITRRFKEIATRKVSGAGTFDIVRQFVTESIVTNGLAVAFSLTLIQIVRAPAAELFNIFFTAPGSLEFGSILILLSIVSAGAVVTGLYPAFISLTHRPRELFNHNSSPGRRSKAPSLLTVAQLTAAMVFIMLTFTVSYQLRYILNMDTGFTKDQIIEIEGPLVKPDNYTTILSALKKEVLKLPDVSSFSASSFPVNQINGSAFNAKRIGAVDSFGMDSNGVDEDFLSHYGLKLLAGRNFLDDELPDRIIVTRSAADRLGYAFPEEAVGARIHVSIQGAPGWGEVEIIGVIENFRNVSFFQTANASQANNGGRGMVLTYKDQLSKTTFTPDVLSVRVSPGHFEENIGYIENLFKREFPSMVFSWAFLDDKINRVYAQEKIARNQIILFTTLAVIIACLGLLGMISNKVAEKTKEIGIRKVLGARLYNIARVLLNTTVKQIALATAIGIPVAYYLTQQYLNKYSEKINLQWWHYAAPVLVLMVIMFLTVTSVLVKAAKTNPVEALKCE
ncbi:MAG TPA: ABC transporter permease [Chryseolinea sp.]